MALLTRARVAGILALCLLLLSSLIATGTLATTAPPEIQAFEAPGPPPVDSCTGFEACEGATGTIGTGSCNGTQACAGSSANIGNNACNGFQACHQATGTIEDCESNVSGSYPPVCVQPDARIRRSGGELWGSNIYNLNAADQYVSMKIYAGDFRRVYLSVQNDGLTPESYTVCQCSGTQGAHTGFNFRYFIRRTNIEITSAVEGGTFTTPILAPGAVYVIRARVEVDGSAAPNSPIGRFFTWSGDDASGADDSVAIWVKRKVNL